jgi:hypothetical protein
MLSLLIFSYVVLVHFLNVLTIDKLVDPRAFELDYLRILIAIGLSTSTAGLVLLLAIRRVAYVNFFKLGIREKLTHLFITIALAYFFATNKYLPLKKELVVFLPVLFVLIAIMPTLIEAYTKLNVLNYRRAVAILRERSNRYKHYVVTYLLFTLVAATVLAINAFLITIITTAYINGDSAREAELRRSVYIIKVAPSKTTQAKKVILYGYNLGWNRDGRSRVMSNGGEIQSGVWNNTEVEFEMPLHIKPGKWLVWTIVPKDDNPKGKLAGSNKVQLEVVSRFEYYPRAGDSFIQRQIKKIKRFIFL